MEFDLENARGSAERFADDAAQAMLQAISSEPQSNWSQRRGIGPVKPAEASNFAELAEAAMQTKSSVSDGNWIHFGAHSSNKNKNVPLEVIGKPDPGLPDVWQQPKSGWMDGKCGITGVSNMLRLYGIEKAPADIDQSKYRSVGPGLRADKFASDLRELSGKNFSAKTIEENNPMSPLQVLRSHINAGKPVAIQYMTSPSEAHWVVVTGIGWANNGPELQVQSWGNYHKVAWKDVQDQWRRGYGGPYPYVVGDDSSPVMKKKR